MTRESQRRELRRAKREHAADQRRERRKVSEGASGGLIVLLARAQLRWATLPANQAIREQRAIWNKLARYAESPGFHEYAHPEGCGCHPHGPYDPNPPYVSHVPLEREPPVRRDAATGKPVRRAW